MFDLDRFVADCRAALREKPAQRAVRETVARAVADPAAVIGALGEPKRGEIVKLHQSADLTVINVVWAPHFMVMPHNHKMWVVIGVYTGREDNLFWRRVKGAPSGRIEAASAQALGAKDAVLLGRDIIHSVVNPIPRLSGAIHVYGGDFFAQPRNEWDSETLCEGPFDPQRQMRRFEEANALNARTR